jgi:hypothetical protein
VRTTMPQAVVRDSLGRRGRSGLDGARLAPAAPSAGLKASAAAAATTAAAAELRRPAASLALRSSCMTCVMTGSAGSRDWDCAIASRCPTCAGALQTFAVTAIECYNSWDG